MILFAGRFRDDIRVIVHKRKCVSVDEVIASVGRIYGKGITVELENIQMNGGKFTDVEWIWNNNEMVLFDNNKNFNDCKFVGSKIRFPEAYTSWKVDVIINTMRGMLFRAKKKSSSLVAWLLSASMLIVECFQKKYKLNWIIRAFSLVDVGNMGLYKCLITGLGGG